MGAPEVSVVLCTVPVGEADQLSDRILTARLAACVNLVGPVRSRYWWDGAVAESEEMLLVMKTRRDAVGKLRDRIAEWHSYDVPECVEVSVDSGLDAYLAWVSTSVEAP